MTPFLTAALALMLVGTSALVSVFAFGDQAYLRGWVVASSGALGLVFAAVGGGTTVLDLSTVAGVILFAGISGAGWRPRGRIALLVLGATLLFIGVLPRAGDFLLASIGFSGASGNLPWDVARAAGFVAFAAATGAVVLGTRRPARLPVGGLPSRVYALHRAFGIVALLAVATHLVALSLDSYIGFSWRQLLLVPWTSSYRPVAVTIGLAALVSLIITAASGALRKRLPGWRFVHLTAYVTFFISILHGILAGTDAGSPAAISLYAGALVLVGATLVRRRAPVQTTKRRAFVAPPERTET